MELIADEPAAPAPARSDWSAPPEDLASRARRRPTSVVGTGVALSVERSGGLFECAEVHVDKAGGVLVVVGSTPTGQGHETLFAQIAAERLGVDPERVTVRAGDSDALADGVGSFASRSTAMGGSAVGPPPTLLANGGSVGRRASSDQVFACGAYAAVVESTARPVRARPATRRGRRRRPDHQPPARRGPGDRWRRPGPRCVLTEEAGEPSLLEYGLLTAAEVPELVTEFIESPSPLNPLLGAKGISKSGTIGAPPAVANALADALGDGTSTRRSRPRRSGVPSGNP